MRNKKSGFTIIEIMMIVAIIGILASLASFGTRGMGERKNLYEIKSGFNNFLQEKTSFFRRRRLNYTISLKNDKIELTSKTEIDMPSTTTIGTTINQKANFKYSLPSNFNYYLVTIDNNGKETLDNSDYEVLVGQNDEELNRTETTKRTLVVERKKDNKKLLEVEFKNVIEGRFFKYTYIKP